MDYKTYRKYQIAEVADIIRDFIKSNPADCGVESWEQGGCTRHFGGATGSLDKMNFFEWRYNNECLHFKGSLLSK